MVGASPALVRMYCGIATVIVVDVTPNDVAPPLLVFGSQNATHGGDCGSSTCRGGSPTHLLTRAPGGTFKTAGVGDAEGVDDVDEAGVGVAPGCGRWPGP